ncbi:MAG: hypothetical protein N3F03_02415 [Ignavibacteria bacterium]|nr:hypothetical protein [Ignavibacteria bacterium]
MKIIKIILIVSLIIFVVGCFPTHSVEKESEAGFLMGIWHGWIAPISLIIGIFDSNIRIYETNNSGWWYDLGFYIAVIAGFGGLALRRRKKNSNF